MSQYKVFEQGWEGEDTVCGWGSQMEHTKNIRFMLPEIIEKLDVKTINDAGCGDFWWIKEVSFGTDIDYMGYDIYDRRRGQGFPFTALDIVNEDMRPCDLILCRDVFIHLPNDMILSTLKRFKKSGSFLFTTTFNSKHIEVNNFDRMSRPQLKHCKLDLSLDPFKLGPGCELVKENSPGKYLGLWDLQKMEIE